MIKEIQRQNAPSEPVGLTSEFHRRFSIESNRSSVSNLAYLMAEDDIDNSDGDDDLDHDQSRRSSASVTPIASNVASRRATFDR